VPLVDKPEISPNQRDFLRIVRAATAIAFGITGGVLAGLKNSGSGLVLEFNVWVVPAILIGAAAAWAYWSFILTRLVRRQTQQKRFRVYTVLLAVAGLLCFLYPMRYVTRGSMSEVIQGVVLAFMTVGVIGLLIWSVARLLNRQDHDQQ
jgi:FtsH-binding integral membrane protein